MIRAFLPKADFLSASVLADTEFETALETIGVDLVNMHDADSEFRDEDWRRGRRALLEDSQKILRSHAKKKASMEEALARDVRQILRDSIDRVAEAAVVADFNFASRKRKRLRATGRDRHRQRPRGKRWAVSASRTST